MPRPAVYRTLDLLETRGLAERVGREPGNRGQNRVVLAATPPGREALREWLSLPVGNVRDVRSIFLLKLLLSARIGIEQRALLDAQRAIVVRSVTELEQRLHLSNSTERVLLRFRLESTRAVVEFIDALLTGKPT